MNDNEMFELLHGIDPLNTGILITPAHSAQALTLMESIMTAQMKSPHSRRRWYSAAAAGVAVAAVTVAVVAVAVVFPGAGSSTALAWTPMPRVATDVDADVARQTCAVPDWTRSRPAEADARGDVAPAPVVLGPLAALDLRGNGGLAVFVDDENVVMCMLTVFDGTPQYAGLISNSSSGEVSDTLKVDGGMTTSIDSNTAVSMLAGQAGSAALVEIRVAGLDPITATLVNGRFAAWWPEPTSGGGTSLDTPITIVSYAADGSELANTVWTVAQHTKDTPRTTTDTSRSTTP